MRVDRVGGILLRVRAWECRVERVVVVRMESRSRFMDGVLFLRLIGSWVGV